MKMEIEMFEKMQETVAYASKVLTEIYPKISKLDRIGFMMLIGTAVDQWCVDHDMTSEETFALMAELCETQKAVHAEIGAMPKSSGR